MLRWLCNVAYQFFAFTWEFNLIHSFSVILRICCKSYIAEKLDSLGCIIGCRLNGYNSTSTTSMSLATIATKFDEVTQNNGHFAIWVIQGNYFQ